MKKKWSLKKKVGLGIGFVFAVYFGLIVLLSSFVVDDSTKIRQETSEVIVITPTSDNPQIMEKGAGYSELGASTNDGSPIVIDDSDFRDAVGSYRIKYNAADQSKNAADEKTRTVNVVGTTPPCPVFLEEVISKNAEAYAERGTEYFGTGGLIFYIPAGDITENYQATEEDAENTKGWNMGRLHSVTVLGETNLLGCSTGSSNSVGYRCLRGSELGQDTSLFYCGKTSTPPFSTLSMNELRWREDLRDNKAQYMKMWNSQVVDMLLWREDIEYDGTVITDKIKTITAVVNVVIDPKTFEVVNVQCIDVSQVCNSKFLG